MIFRDYTDFEPCIFSRTPEGYLTGRIRVTNAGVFRYLVDGGMRNRLRSIKEVGDEKSISTLNSKPVTLRHPSDDVSPENAKRLQVGFSGTDASFDGINAWVTLTITDAEAIAACESGEVKAVSCGYAARLSPDRGNWLGMEYDEAMSEIRYNHIALVRAGRAGDGVTFRIGDCADVEKIFNNKNGERKDMKKMLIDGVEYEADEKVIEKLHATEKALDEANEKVSSVTAEKDAVAAARDAANSEIEKLKASAKDESEINKMVDAKVALLDSAKKFGIEVKSSDSIADIKSAFVKKAFPKMDLADKSADYVAAAYDMACQSLEAEGEKKPSPFAPKFGDMKDEADPEQAYKAMCERRFNPKKEGK